MGLRKITQDEETSYMYSNTSKAEEISIILLRDNLAFSANLKTEDEVVKKWCRNLQKTPQEYMTLLHKAVEICSVLYNEEDTGDKKEDVFEIQEDCLVWKQYFPEKKVYGRRGKFNLDKISYEEAVKVVLNGTLGDLSEKSNSINKLTDDLHKKSKELHHAKALTAKSINEKEEFEKEIYGKCVVLINAKKQRIRQLMDGQPSTSGNQINLVRQILTNTQSTEESDKPNKSGPVDSDGYSSDTDIDDPQADDVDTDEENLRKSNIQKRKITLKPKTVPEKKTRDSEDIFNNSLEAELYATDRREKRQKKDDKSSAKDLKSSNGSKDVEVLEIGSHSSYYAKSDTQRSIFEELF